VTFKAFEDLAGFHDWFGERLHANDYDVEQIPIDELAGWHTDAASGDIVHDSGKFFAVRGLEVATDHRVTGTWTQPIIVQPEIGILGLVVKVVDGAVHCLMQAKMEPGNINTMQLSPTTQATRSNYMRVHNGKRVPYLEHFLAPRHGRIVFDALQSEHGSWFLRKRNRNMIVEVAADVPMREDFCWLRLEQIAELLREPNLVNMDARTVLSGIPFFYPEREDDGCGLHPFAHLLSWFTEIKSRFELTRRLVPLRATAGWRRHDGVITHAEGRYFSVIGISVRASNREVGSWSQPMFRPIGRGLIAFLGRHIDGVFHVLVQARTEAGTHDVVEMGPTVSCIPESYTGLPVHQRPRYLDAVDWDLPGQSHLFDVVHSEEGGRFFHAENRYVLTDVGGDFPLDVPDDYCWMTPEQLTRFVRFGNLVNVAARCLLSCLVGATAGPRTGRFVRTGEMS
jgi:oxidase EvaA